MAVKIHEKYIKRCIEIAKNGLGSTAPNPMVGCVIVHNEKIIGEGYTSSYGGNHAEINALKSVKDKSLLDKSTLYVTLEPCSHFGKTPPCAEAIVKYEIPSVIIGTMDTNNKVSGKGIEKLQDSGCEVIVGILEDECKAHHKRFFTFHDKKRPYIILKWAQTLDGFIAPDFKTEQKPAWITNKISRQMVHKWRAEEQAILVGTNTVLQDNPSLTVRDWTGKNPIRVVLDKDLKLSEKFQVFTDDAETIIICDKRLSNRNESIEERNVHLEFLDWSIKDKFASQICSILHEQFILSIIIEGGTQTIQTFIDENLWDEARVFIGKANFNEGIKAPIISGTLLSEEKIIEDILKIYVKDKNHHI